MTTAILMVLVLIPPGPLPMPLRSLFKNWGLLGANKEHPNFENLLYINARKLF